MTATKTKNLTAHRISTILARAGISTGEGTGAVIEGREVRVFIARKIMGDDGVEVDDLRCADAEKTDALEASIIGALETAGYLIDTLRSQCGEVCIRQGRVKTAAEQEIDDLPYCHPANRAHY